jgi:hypothetical protein
MNRTRNSSGQEHSTATAAVMEPDDDDFMMRILDGSCQGVFRDGEGGCQSILPSCHLQDQIDLLTVSVLGVTKKQLKNVSSHFFLILYSTCFLGKSIAGNPCLFFVSFTNTETRIWQEWKSYRRVRMCCPRVANIVENRIRNIAIGISVAVRRCIFKRNDRPLPNPMQVDGIPSPMMP